MKLKPCKVNLILFQMKNASDIGYIHAAVPEFFWRCCAFSYKTIKRLGLTVNDYTAADTESYSTKTWLYTANKSKIAEVPASLTPLLSSND